MSTDRQQAPLVSQTFEIGGRYRLTISIPQPRRIRRGGLSVVADVHWEPHRPGTDLSVQERAAAHLAAATITAQAAALVGRPAVLRLTDAPVAPAKKQAGQQH